ncbi:MAG: hypothetical protein OEY62_01675, partial [Acidimicrobiia bacterium]|nr:hypothetical protein [Acidimicrobiia bacterium]
CYSAATDHPPQRVCMLKYISRRMSQMILVPVAFLTATLFLGHAQPVGSSRAWYLVKDSA